MAQQALIVYYSQFNNTTKLATASIQITWKLLVASINSS